MLRKLAPHALALALIFGVAAPSAFAYDVTSPSAVNVDNKVILHGYDAVAYQTVGKPVYGSSKITAVHEGATYQFASEANKAKFTANPAKYAPAYGGYCAFGAAIGKKFDIDPNAFKVVDGRLYVNLNPEILARWQQDVPGQIATANRNWPTIKDKAPNAL
jgi:YHS domain-containing protein